MHTVRWDFFCTGGRNAGKWTKINGQSAGLKHQGAFYRFKYDISDKLHFDKANLLEVTVSKMSSDETVNNAERLADYWVLGGIFRPVYLEAVPEEHVDHVAIDAKADGNFNMNVYTENLKREKSLLTEIVDAKGKKLSSVSTPAHAGDTVIR